MYGYLKPRLDTAKNKVERPKDPEDCHKTESIWQTDVH